MKMSARSRGMGYYWNVVGNMDISWEIKENCLVRWSLMPGSHMNMRWPGSTGPLYDAGYWLRGKLMDANSGRMLSVFLVEKGNRLSVKQTGARE